MQRMVLAALISSALAAPSLAEPLSLQADSYAQPGYRRTAPAIIAPPQPIPMPQPAASAPMVRYANADPDMNSGGGFLDFLFEGGRPPRPPANMDARTAAYGAPAQSVASEQARPEPDPKYLRQIVAYGGPEKPGTIIIDTPQRFLFLVQDNGTAVRYGIGVGRPGFTWAGEKKITRQEGMAGLDAAARDAAAAAGPAGLDGGRAGQSARRARALSRLLALSHPWLERALDDRTGGLVGMHPHAQRGRDGPL